MLGNYKQTKPLQNYPEPYTVLEYLGIHSQGIVFTRQ